MLMIHATMTCDTDADFERLKALSSAVLHHVRAEPGCVASYFAVDALEPRTLHSIARYHDEAALTAHLQEPATQDYIAALGALSRVVTTGAKYEVLDERPLFAGTEDAALGKLAG